jgi:hypothetical protein
MFKTCTKCIESKDISEFCGDRRRIDGHTSTCKLCYRNIRKAYYDHEYVRTKARSRRHKVVNDRTGCYPYWYAKNEARKRNKGWSLTKEHYYKLTSLNCHYCLCPLNKTGIGLDRLNNSIGYTADNVVPCCTICNYVRYNIFTVEEMKLLGTTIAQIKHNRSLNNDICI